MCYTDDELSIPNTEEPCGFSLSVNDDISARLKVYLNPMAP
jgi:hypothetical protein